MQNYSYKQLTKIGMMKRKIKSSLLTVLLIISMTIIAKGQNQNLDLNLKNVSIETLIKEIKARTEADFLYNIKEIEKCGNTTINVKNKDINTILNQVFRNKPLEFKVINGVFVIKPNAYKEGEKVKIKGRVKDNDNNPMTGVTVMLLGGNYGVSTDKDGLFELVIKDKPENIILRFSFIGMITQDAKYENKFMEILMEKEVSELGNVVVTGYQKIDARKNTSAIQSIKMEDILVPGMNSLEQALEGNVPEMAFMLNSGEVGATPRIRIRGTSTLIGNREPLWVVDGFPLSDPVNVSNDDLNNPDYVNIVGNAIQGINPQDIARIDILKDASATALWGTKAANGVIVVTTKRGKKGKPSISYNHQSKFTIRPRYTDKAINLMNSQERVQIGKDLVDAHYVFPSSMSKVGYEGAWYKWQTGLIGYNEFEGNVKWFETVNTDWFKELTKDTYSHDHTISISGGSDNIRYYTSISYNRDNGVSKSTYTERMSGRANLNATITSNLRLNFNLSANAQKKNHIPSDINTMDYAYNTTRALPAYHNNGDYYYYDVSKYGHGAIPQSFYNFNILNEVENASDNYDGTGINTMIDIRWKPIRGLEISAAGNYSASSTEQSIWWGEKTNYVARYKNGEYNEAPKKGIEGKSALPYGGILNSSFSKNSSWMTRFQADYRKTFGEDNNHQLFATLGYEVRSSNYGNYKTDTRGYFKDRGMQFVNVDNIEDFPLYQEWMGRQHQTISNGLSNTISGYLTASYSYKDILTVNANTRFDSSNKFGSRSNERFLPVWSISGMLNLNEIFTLNENIFSDLRLRGSFGKQGNMLDDQSPEFIIKLGVIDPYFNQNISTAQRYPNPNLRWEQTNQWNLGADLRLFNYRLNLGISIYGKKTKDAFTTIKSSTVNGVNKYVMNGADISNSGYSISLSGYIMKSRDFSWYMSTYYGGNFNSVDSKSVETYKYNDYLNGNAFVSGEAISTFYSYDFKGLNPITGAPMFRDYEDQQHLLKGLSLEETVKKIMINSGTREPIFNGSISTSITYKRLSLSVMFSYSLGSKIRLFGLYSPIARGIRAEDNLRKEFSVRWKNQGDEYKTDIPAIISSSNPYFRYYNTHYSSTAIRDDKTSENIQKFASNVWEMYDKSQMRVVSGDYIKLTSLSLRYSLNSKLLKSTPFKSMSVSFSTRDVFTIASRALKGQEPSQAGFDKPNLSIRPSYSLQIQITF